MSPSSHPHSMPLRCHSRREAAWRRGPPSLRLVGEGPLTQATRRPAAAPPCALGKGSWGDGTRWRPGTLVLGGRSRVELQPRAQLLPEHPDPLLVLQLHLELHLPLPQQLHHDHTAQLPELLLPQHLAFSPTCCHPVMDADEAGCTIRPPPSSQLLQQPGQQRPGCAPAAAAVEAAEPGQQGRLPVSATACCHSH